MGAPGIPFCILTFGPFIQLRPQELVFLLAKVPSYYYHYSVGEYLYMFVLKHGPCIFSFSAISLPYSPADYRTSDAVLSAS